MPSSIIHGKVGSRTVPARKGEAGGMAGVLRDCAGRDRTVFFFGGDSRAIYALREHVAAAFPGLRVAGICDADFAGPIDRAVLGHIAAAHADVIVTDLSEARFRLFGAQCSVAGIYGNRVNLPGSFPDFAFGLRRGFIGPWLPARLRRIGSSARAGLSFARVLLIQALCRVLPSAGTVNDPAVSPRRGGRGCARRRP